MKPMTVDYKPASRTVRQLAGTNMVYNDAIKGGRSFKVIGWGKNRYDAAKKQLDKRGYTTKVVNVGAQVGWAGNRLSTSQYRIYVR